MTLWASHHNVRSSQDPGNGPRSSAMTNHEGQLPNDAGEQSRDAAVQATPVPAQPGTSHSAMSASPASPVLQAASNETGAEGASPDARPAKAATGSRRKRESEPADVTSNNVRRIRIELMLSKAEVARRANISVLTLDRVERGYGCRVDTKRKILEALGLSLADRIRVFGEEE